MKITSASEASIITNRAVQEETARVLWILSRRIRRNAAVGMRHYCIRGVLPDNIGIELSQLGYHLGVDINKGKRKTYIRWA
jgi:hypothetical protein